ncbi:hypothetical protein B0H13DRAFT_2051604 [Mycena leptocephala]|nr:hypothetical protein B0H13DRAFT_2051604 [Mycena leptocephala]
MDDVQPLLLPQTHTATDIFIDTIASTSGTSTVDIPITEIEMRPILHKKPTLPTEPRVLSIHGPREELPEQELPIGPDIHDVNRQKIVIRPRCKEYVQKQKQRSIRTLACFSATLQNSDENEKTPDHDPNPDADPESDVAMKDIVTSFAVKDAKKTAPSITNQAPSIDPVHEEESDAQETPGRAAHRTSSNGTSGIEQATGHSILGTHRETPEVAPTYGRGAGPPDGRVLCGCFGAIRTLQLWMFGAR